jgi:hypothetical protein
VSDFAQTLFSYDATLYLGGCAFMLKWRMLSLECTMNIFYIIGVVVVVIVVAGYFGMHL